MKTFKSALLLCVITLALFSCQKADLTSLKSQDNDGASLANYGDESREEGGEILSSIYDWEEFCHNPPEDDGVDTTGLIFCTRMTVPLCTSRGTNIGTVTVKTGSDKNTYVTYTLNPNWYFYEINLYAGTEAGLPLTAYGYANPTKYPYQKHFYSAQTSWSFRISGLPSYFTVSAQANAVKVSYNRIVDQQVAWGDGCSGTRINLLNWATKFNYLRGNCMAEEEQICAKPVNYFFDSTLNGVDIAWPDVNGSPIALLDSLGLPIVDILGLPIVVNNNGNVTIGGQNYTEAEGRAIFKTVTPGVMPDSKNGFIHLATLRLSSTAVNQAKDATLLMAVNTIETWLATKGKLSPTNLPTGNIAVRNAANFISTWIKIYTCSDRR
jgi:hypothetical protein